MHQWTKYTLWIVDETTHMQDCEMRAVKLMTVVVSTKVRRECGCVLGISGGTMPDATALALYFVGQRRNLWHQNA
jgi:hypothetical protein